MTTTVVRDSIVGDAWIQQCVQNVPIQPVMDEKTGQPTGDYLTGPVRIAFESIMELDTPSATNQNPKYGASLLFPPMTIFDPMYALYYEKCAELFPEAHDAGTGQYLGLHSPFRDQGEKAKFSGFTPGCVFITATSQYKPPVVDVRGNPVVDRSKVYPGAWAICGVNAYAYGKNPPQPKKGIGFGLQSVMLIGDDTNFMQGAQADTKQIYSQVQGRITAPPVQPGTGQGGHAGAPPPPPGTSSMPPPPPGGTGYSAPPPPPPPGGGQYTMPGQPPAGDPRGPVPAGFTSWAEYDDMMG